MNSRLIIGGSAWLITLLAAYLVGVGSREPTDGNPNSRSASATDRTPAPSKSSRATRSAEEAGRGRVTTRGARIVTAHPPREAVAVLARLTDPVARAEGFLALAATLDADSFAGVVAEFRSLGLTEERMSEYGILLHAWGQADPEGALDYAIENTGTPFARQTILASWAAYDPDAALAFANGNAEEGKPNGLLVGVIRGMAPEDLPRATHIMGTLPRSVERGEALRSILPLVLREGVDGALAWTGTIGESILRQGATTYIAESVAESDPRRAAEIVLALPDREFQTRNIDDISRRWAEESLDEAVAWAESLEPDVLSRAAEGIVAEMASDDPARASEWMESLAGTTNLDPAIGTFVRQAARSDPELALAWNGQVGSDRFREHNYHSVLGAWMRNDPEAARSWIAARSAELPESLRRRFGSDRQAAPGGGER